MDTRLIHNIVAIQGKIYFNGFSFNNRLKKKTKTYNVNHTIHININKLLKYIMYFIRSTRNEFVNNFLH